MSRAKAAAQKRRASATPRDMVVSRDSKRGDHGAGILAGDLDVLVAGAAYRRALDAGGCARHIVARLGFHGWRPERRRSGHAAFAGTVFLALVAAGAAGPGRRGTGKSGRPVAAGPDCRQLDAMGS